MLNAGYARIVLVVAIGVFLAQGWYLAGAQVGYNEEVVGHAAPPATEIVVEDHVARAISICDGHSRIAFSRGGDPHLVLCAGGLAWPILVNSYIGGVLYWPLQVLRPLHHGNLIALRRTALPIGALAISPPRTGGSRAISVDDGCSRRAIMRCGLATAIGQARPADCLPSW